MTNALPTRNDENVTVLNPKGQSSVIVVCEHASHFIPPEYNNLGLADAALQSHVAWDPGAFAVAQGVSRRLNATLVASGVSRLVYDCNRPPSAPDAMPDQSEAIKVPGNAHLTAAQRQDRTDKYYEPFRAALAQTINTTSTPVIVTIHSFTPIYYGKKRDVEIGVLHDNDSRLADAMLQIAPQHTDTLVLRNDPYGPAHGVTHTLKEHALKAGHLNVMLEIRNDLIENAQQQDKIATSITDWLLAALARLQAAGAAQC
tara:strand:+ start:7697 stop:8470 length:774 start_codon:yes stop_codon:yes gene_type:complete